jgi:hypothetical protein
VYLIEGFGVMILSDIPKGATCVPTRSVCKYTQFYQPDFIANYPPLNRHPLHKLNFNSQSEYFHDAELLVAGQTLDDDLRGEILVIKD